MIVKLLHDITQEGYRVDFSDDFDGMISVTYYQDAHPGNKGGYIRHEHLSFPGGGMANLEKKIIESLSNFYEEIKDGGKPEKDELADA